MIAKSIKGKSVDEIRSALDDSMTDGYKPTLAIVFLSIEQDREGLCDLLDKHGISIFGATTGGEFIDEVLEKGSAAILLLDMNRNHFFVQFKELNGVDDHSISKGLGEEAVSRFKKPAFLISGSNLITNAEELLNGFTDAVNDEINVFGAMAGDDFTNTEQFVFTNGHSSSRGIVTVVLDEDKIMVKGRALSAWKAFGTPKTVTKSEGNRVYTIEGIPALDILTKYGGLTNVHPENDELVLELATSCSLQLQREHGDPVMRPGLVINWDDHSFICSGSVPQGSKVRFSLPPDFDVIEKVIEGCQELKDTEMPEADALIMFSCLGRYFSLGPLMSKEIEEVKAIWDVPMAGFFSNAELGRALGGKLEMHNLTSCNVVLKEKEL